MSLNLSTYSAYVRMTSQVFHNKSGTGQSITHNNKISHLQTVQFQN